MTAPDPTQPDPTQPEPTTPNEPIPEPVIAPEAPQDDESSLPPWAREKLSKVQREAQNLRTRLHEVEPLAAKAREFEEAQKTEIQRATERAAALEAQLATTQLEAERNALAAQHSIPPTHFKFIVGNTAEERAESAKGVAEMLGAAAAPHVVPPPSNRPTQALQPGAAPPAPDTPATTYPSWFLPKPPRGG